MVIRTGLARKPWTNYKTSNYIIAYLDILGAKDMICNDTNFDFLNYLNMFMEDVIEESGRGIFPKDEDIYIKIFSDNVLLAIELKEDDEQREHKIAILFNTVANIYNEILRYGYLMRGAIVEGEFFHNDIIVYGKGLVEAVQLEENVAKYPRIMVKTKVNEANSWHYLMKDSDGEAFLNIFGLCEGVDDATFKINLLGLLKKYKNNEKIKEKIMWMINYFNSWFIQCGDPIMNEQKITEEEIREALS